MYVYKIGDPSESQYQYWTLKHVESIRFSLNKSSQPYGIPTKSSSATQIFENQGPTCQINLDFVRFDYEEDVPNWDFMFTKGYKVGSAKYKGIDWYTSKLQTTRPYRLIIYWERDFLDGTTDPGIVPTGTWDVSINSISYNMSPTNPGMGEFSITMVERRK